MEIIIDTREQNPYIFTNIKPKPKIIYKGLKTGDYSISGFEQSGISIERKSLSDLFGSVGGGRKRFENEFKRLSKFDYPALILEGGLNDIFLNPPGHTKMNPKSVFRTLLSWSIRYGVYIWTPPDRVFAEKLTYLLLEKYHKEIIKMRKT
jgi:ERCC4-type nuclease